jgi:hypothetical protein
MHIYENFAAVERGILIERSAVGVRGSDGGLVLGFAAMDEAGASRCGRCRIVAYAPEKVVLEASAQEACYLLFQDMYYPGWKVYIDSEPTQFIKTDVGFRVVEVPEGNHTIEMEFRPGSLKVGLGLTCLGCLVTVLYARRMRKSTPETRSSEVETL